MKSDCENSESFRHLCECRYWLKQTKADRGSVNNVIAKIEIQRGSKAAQRLREGMRDEFKRGRRNG